MNTYKIEFLTLDGNFNFVEIDAERENVALRTFEENYTFKEILAVKQLFN
jgi:hypothetical protein